MVIPCEKKTQSVQPIAKHTFVTDFIHQRNIKALAWQVKNQPGGDPVLINEYELRELKNCIRFYESELKKLSELLPDGNAKQIKAKQNAIGNSFRCSQVVVLVWAERYGIKLSKPQIYSIAKQVKFSNKCYEKIRSKVEPKNNGGFRTVSVFKKLRRSRAIIAEDVFSICSQHNPFEFNRRKHGSKRAITIVRLKIAEGYKYWAVLDIKNAYPSVRRGHCKELAVMSEWILDALFPYGTCSKATPKKAAQTALPQGMASSPKVLSALVGQALGLLPEQLVCLNYSDDLLLGAKTIEELKKAVEALEKYFASLRSGPLHFGKVDYVDLNTNKGIKYLGYLITVDCFTKEIRIRPAPKTFDRHWRKQYDVAIEKFEDGYDYEFVMSRIEENCTSWLGQFPCWKYNKTSINIFHTQRLQVVHDAWLDFSHSKTSDNISDNASAIHKS